MSANCSICLGRLKTPVATPCGHVHCEKCLTDYVNSTPDAMNASCPDCRAEFPIVMPDLRFLPAKYHPFVTPSFRRIYLDGTSADLRKRIARLEASVTTLKAENGQLMDKCEHHLSAIRVHREGETNAWAEAENLAEELAEANDGEYEALEEVASLQEANARLRAKNTSLKENVNGLCTEIEELNESLDQANETIQDTQDKLADKSSEMIAVLTEHAETRRKYEKSKRRYSELQRDRIQENSSLNPSSPRRKKTTGAPGPLKRKNSQELDRTSIESEEEDKPRQLRPLPTRRRVVANQSSPIGTKRRRLIAPRMSRDEDDLLDSD